MRHVFAVGLMALAACGEGSSWDGTVTDSAGVTIVTNGRAGVWREGEAWQVRETLRIGVAEGDPDYQFGRIVGIARGSDGRLFVLDQQAQHVRVFTAAGQFERQFGRAGSGPGELGPAAGPVLKGRGDTLYVPDAGAQRVNLFREDGTFLSSFRLGLEGGIPLRFDATDQGELVVQRRPLNLPNQPAPTDSLDAVLILQPDGGVLDTLLRVPSGRTITFARGGPPRVTLFVAEPLWGLRGPRALLFGVNDAFRIEQRAAGGALESVFTRPVERAPVTDADKEAIFTGLENAWRGVGLTAQQVAAARERFGFAEYFPAYAQFQAGPQGTTWVQRILRPSDLPPEDLERFDIQRGFGSSTWDVFDGEGRYLGPVDLPRDFSPLRFEGMVIYGVWRDDLDVQYVMKLDIVGAD